MRIFWSSIYLSHYLKMKRIRNLSILVLMLGLLTSCGSEKKGDAYYNDLIRISENVGVENMDPDNVLMVINMRGCSVCYSKALYFLGQNLNLNSVTYIITGIQSKKNLRIRLGDEVVESAFVYLDTKNLFFSGGIDEPYPIIVYRKDGLRLEIDIAGLDNKDAYSKLANYLNQGIS